MGRLNLGVRLNHRHFFRHTRAQHFLEGHARKISQILGFRQLRYRLREVYSPRGLNCACASCPIISSVLPVAD